MAFIWALRGALVGAAGVVAAIGFANTPKMINVANDTHEAIFVVIESFRSKNESIIEPGESKEFAVSDVKPTYVRVRKSTKDTYDAQVTDYEHRNFIVIKASTGDLVLVPAKKGTVWEPVLSSQKNKKQNELGRARKDGLYPHGHPNQSIPSRENYPSFDRWENSNHY